MAKGLRLGVRLCLLFVGTALVALIPGQAEAAGGYKYTYDSSNRFSVCEWTDSGSQPKDTQNCFRYFLFQSNTRYDFRQPDTGTIHVEGGNPRSGSLKFNNGQTSTVTITDEQKFRSRFPEATQPAQDTEETKKIRALLFVRIKEGVIGEDRVVGPLDVQLKTADGKTVLSTAKSNTSSENVSGSNNAELEAMLTGVNPGTYQICVPAMETACQTATKVVGTMLTLEFRGDAKPEAFTVIDGVDSFDTDCSQSAGALAWFFCPIIRVINNAIKSLVENVIVPSLQITPLDSSQSGQLYPVWSAMRNLANVAFVFVFMFIVFANVLSINIDNYTIKKMLPRLVVASILVQFSFLITGLIVDLGNVLGNGILLLVDGALGGGAGGNAGTVARVVTSFATGVAITSVAAYFAAPALVGLAISFMVGVLTTLATLVVREIVIDLAIVVSPLAMAAWILPNTENFFRKWIKTFVLVVMMYPFIMLLIAAGNIVSKTAGGDRGGNFANLIKLLAPTITFLMIPATFKLASSALGAAGRLIQGGGESLKRKYNEGAKKDWEQSIRERRAQLAGNADQATGGWQKLQKRAAGRSVKGFSFGRAADRKLDRTYDQAIDNRAEDAQREFRRRGLSDDAIAQIGQAKLGTTVHDMKVDQATQTAALDYLGNKGDDRRIRQIHQAMGGYGIAGENKRVFEYGTRKHRSLLNEKAPDLLHGESAFAAPTANSVSGWSESTIRAATSFYGSNPSRSAFADGAAGDRAHQDALLARGIARDRFTSAIQGISENATLRSKVKPGAGRAIEEASIVFSGQTVQTRKHGSVDAVQFVQDVIQDDGTFREYSGPSTSTGGTTTPPPSPAPTGGPTFAVGSGGAATTVPMVPVTPTGPSSPTPTTPAAPTPSPAGPTPGSVTTPTPTPATPLPGAAPGTVTASPSTATARAVVAAGRKISAAASVDELLSAGQELAANSMPGVPEYEAAKQRYADKLATMATDASTRPDHRVRAQEALRTTNPQRYNEMLADKIAAAASAGNVSELVGAGQELIAHPQPQTDYWSSVADYHTKLASLAADDQLPAAQRAQAQEALRRSNPNRYTEMVTARIRSADAQERQRLLDGLVADRPVGGRLYKLAVERNQTPVNLRHYVEQDTLYRQDEDYRRVIDRILTDKEAGGKGTIVSPSRFREVKAAAASNPALAMALESLISSNQINTAADLPDINQYQTEILPKFQSSSKFRSDFIHYVQTASGNSAAKLPDPSSYADDGQPDPTPPPAPAAAPAPAPSPAKLRSEQQRQEHIQRLIDTYSNPATSPDMTREIEKTLGSSRYSRDDLVRAMKARLSQHWLMPAERERLTSILRSMGY